MMAQIYVDIFSVSQCNGRLFINWLNPKASAIEKRQIVMLKE
ncbi:MAG: hypothetical protein ABI169_13815 [Chitinophagaceae bacterium]